MNSNPRFIICSSLLYPNKFIMVKIEEHYNREQHMKYHKIYAEGIGSIYGMDILVYQKPTIKQKGIYILVIIDYYSRNMGAWLQSEKDAETTLASFKEIIERYFEGILPEEVYMDSGTEFKGVMTEYLEENDVKIFITLGDGVADKNRKLENSLTERVNGTIRSIIKERIYVQHGGDLDERMLNDVVLLYNDREHSGIGNKIPKQCFKGNEIPDIVVHKHNKPTHNSKPMTFKVGDKVRITLQFNKQMKNNAKRIKLNSKEVYRIIERNKNKYLLGGINKWYKYSRLMKSKQPVTENPEGIIEIEEVDNHADAFNEEERNERLRRQPAGNDNIAGLLAYNNQWANHHGFEVADIDLNAPRVRTRGQRARGH